jgi:peptidoglycan hydrolase-like protein with peptidoglycan-binding domain
MRTTAQLRRLWDPPCEFERRSLTLYSGATLQGLNAIAFEAFQALDGVMRTFGYVPRANSPGAWETGAYNCRKITNGKGYSLHAFGIAADINARTNPYGKTLITDMSMAMIAASKSIKTAKGVQVFRWGGDYPTFKDAMHFEVVASPGELSAGIDWASVVAEPPDQNDPRTWSTVRTDDRGPSVAKLKELLAENGYDGGSGTVFDTKTLAAIKSYQESRKLTVDGIVGLQTWTALLKSIPAVDDEAESPFKREVTTKPDRPTIKSGAKGSIIEELQRRLNDHGFDLAPIDGVFGKKTKAALVAFQKANGLEPDGVCGPLTWRAILI